MPGADHHDVTVLVDAAATSSERLGEVVRAVDAGGSHAQIVIIGDTGSREYGTAEHVLIDIVGPSHDESEQASAALRLVRAEWVIAARPDELLALARGGHLDTPSADEDVDVVSFSLQRAIPDVGDQRREILHDNFVGELVAVRTEALRRSGDLAVQFVRHRPWAPVAWIVLDGGRATTRGGPGSGTGERSRDRSARSVTASGLEALASVGRHPSLKASEKEVLVRTIERYRKRSPAASLGAARNMLPIKSNRVPTARSGRRSHRGQEPRDDARPTVSVVLSFFNEARFINSAIDTVRRQTLHDWELLLVDDGSTDASPALAREAAAASPDRVRVVRHPGGVNRGLPASRNLGLSEARAGFIAFLDADDGWEPHKLERQVALMHEQPAAVMLCGPTWHRHSDATVPPTLKPVMRGAPRTVGRGRFAVLGVSGKLVSPSPSNVMYRTSVLLAIGGVPGGDNLYEDQRTMIAVSLRGPVHVTGEVLSSYTVRPDSLFGSLADDLRTRRVQKRRFERWVIMTGLRSGPLGYYLVVRLVVKMSKAAVRRSARSLRTAMR